jgi:hypothetical protein
VSSSLSVRTNIKEPAYCRFFYACKFWKALSVRRWVTSVV